MAKRTPFDRRLWAAWVFATLVGSSISELAATAIAVTWLQGVADPSTGLSGDNGLAPAVLWGCGLLGALGALLGFLQGWVLRRTLLAEKWHDWVLINLLGLVLATVAFLFASLIKPGSGLWVPGLFMGFAQAIVLQGYIDGVGWWILGNGLAWILGAIAGIALSTPWIPRSGNYDLPFYPADGIVHWAIGWAIGALVFATITGLLLTWLLNKPPLNPADAAASTPIQIRDGQPPA